MITKLYKIQIGTKHMRAKLALLIVIVAGSPVYGGAQVKPDTAWLLEPAYTIKQLNYIMTAKVRLLLFWAGADDVGGGYIRHARSSTEGSRNLIQVLFGSDPAKAPRKINHWGAATEAMGERSTAFFGFMKSANSDSAGGAEAEIARQKADGRHRFEAIISTVEPDRAVSRIVPLFSNKDFDLRQLEEARRLVLERLGDNRPVRELTIDEARCRSGRGFLQAIKELIEQGLSGTTAGASLCYVYNARLYTVTLERQSNVPEKQVRVKRRNGDVMQRTYRELQEMRFTVVKQEQATRTKFELLVGTRGDLKGVPVQIVYQPNWWFQVVLNLDDARR